MQSVRNGYWKQNLPEDVTLWVEGGHNLDAGKVLSEMLAELDAPRLIIGMLKNKDCAGYLQCIAPYLDGAQSLTIPDTKAALSAEAIANLHSQVQPARDFTYALDQAVRSGGKNLIVCGSLYLVGAFLARNEAGTEPADI